jgi:phosphotriesterase-related protein
VKGPIRGKIQTVLGPIEPGDLGITLAHEHLLIDLSCYWAEPPEASARAYVDRPVTIDLVGRMGWLWHVVRANLQNFDVSETLDEVKDFVLAGGNSIVDTTSVGLARDPLALARISRATGLNIVMGAGYYVPSAHPDDIDDLTEDELFSRIVRDVTMGVGDTGIKSGVIGEIGNEYPLGDNERRILRAAARASVATGAPISIHTGPNDDSPLEIMEVLVRAGADPHRVIMGHLDYASSNPVKLRTLAKTGCFLEYDLFGIEGSNWDYVGTGGGTMNDSERIETLGLLAGLGHLGQVLVGHDACQTNELARGGAPGYGHILETIVPRLRDAGFSPEQIDAILVHNPARALAFV